ncbi:cytochrome P450 [Micromonospora sp. WMMD812]|uniref:cytochrome P450 n=1 Tax=Micromonospora sp. WMMD812 TaxID=3015152 RepID=UPI00248D2991|nr:cytochrome P450 [Micromonospora sp. WMMD812]WBB69276.1 cytochrome P450 [Micromonospora sp. WMMD812]
MTQSVGPDAGPDLPIDSDDPPRPPTGVGDGRALGAWLDIMRASHPVWRDPLTGSAHVFRYHDLLHVLSAPEVYGSDFTGVMPPSDPSAPNFAEGVLTMIDPPRHGKLRRLVSQAFTPRVITALEPRIIQLTKELLDTVADLDEFDLVAVMAHPLPVIVIAEMLGIPAEDRELFRAWGEALLSTNYELETGEVPDNSALPPDVVAQLTEMRDYLLRHVDQHRRNPRDNLTSRLAFAEVDGDRLTDQEIVSFLNFLLLAGHLTTSLLMGNSLLCFAEAPEAELAARANRTLIPGAIEEVLRFKPPVVMQARLTTMDTVLAGVELPARTPVMGWPMSGNRDERQYTSPSAFDITRNPNPHLTFGHGIHFCIGAPLGRMEARSVLNELFDRYRSIEIGEPRYYDRSPDVFGVKALPVTVKRS